MEDQKSPNRINPETNQDDTLDQPSTIRRRRIPYAPTSFLLSSDRIDLEESEILDPEAEVTEEDLILLSDPDMDQDFGVDELHGSDQYLDDTDFDGDPLNEESGSHAVSGSDLDVPDEELDNAGSALQQEDEENDYFGHRDDVVDLPDLDEV